MGVLRNIYIDNNAVANQLVQDTFPSQEMKCTKDLGKTLVELESRVLYEISKTSDLQEYYDYMRISKEITEDMKYILEKPFERALEIIDTWISQNKDSSGYPDKFDSVIRLRTAKTFHSSMLGTIWGTYCRSPRYQKVLKKLKDYQKELESKPLV